MRIALVFNPFKYKIHEENIKIVQKYFGLFPPLSLAWVAAIAEKAGHKVILIDARTLQLSKEETLRLLRDFKPDAMGFMMTTYMFRDTLEWIRYLKSHLSVPVIVGGYNLRVYPKESLAFPEIDFGIVEHAYYTLPALLAELEKKSPDFNNVPGLVYKKDGEIIVTEHPLKIDFDQFPNPARHLLPNELYAEFPTERRNFTVMVTSLGCPRGCTFCEAGRTAYNPRSPQTVIREMEECCERYGIREIDIFDYDFTALRSRTLEICRLIQDRGLDVSWACRSRIDNVDLEVLCEMKKAGCNRIYFGIESGDPEILKAVDKNVSLEQVKTTLKNCRTVGIRTLGFFLIGAPGDTRETVQKTVRFAKSLDLDYVQFSKTLAKPLTPLWKDMVKATGKDYWCDWILGKEIDRDLPRPWTELTNDEINGLAKWAYLSYHGRPGYILKQLVRLRSWREFWRKGAAFFGMVFSQERVSKEDKNFQAFNENDPSLLQAARNNLEKRTRGEVLG